MRMGTLGVLHLQGAPLRKKEGLSRTPSRATNTTHRTSSRRCAWHLQSRWPQLASDDMDGVTVAATITGPADKVLALLAKMKE
jgi:hypothetical protein